MPPANVANGIKALEKLDTGSFESVATKHVHALPPKISANFWVAMSTSAGLKVM